MMDDFSDLVSSIQNGEYSNEVRESLTREQVLLSSDNSDVSSWVTYYGRIVRNIDFYNYNTGYWGCIGNIDIGKITLTIPRNQYIPLEQIYNTLSAHLRNIIDDVDDFRLTMGLDEEIQLDTKIKCNREIESRALMKIKKNLLLDELRFHPVFIETLLYNSDNAFELLGY